MDKIKRGAICGVKWKERLSIVSKICYKIRFTVTSEHFPERRMNPQVLGEETLELLGVSDLSKIQILHSWDDLT